MSDPTTEPGPDAGDRARAAARLQAVAARPAPGRRRPTRRHAVLAASVLVLGIIAARQLGREAEAPTAPPEGRIVFIDVEGWYRRTPDEVAVLTPHQLSLDQLPAGLPLQIGRWQGHDRGHDPAVDRWFRNPDLSIERTYRRDDGEIVWLSAFGSQGRKSFHLFEHTPDTCYPLGGWQIEQFGVARLPFGPQPLSVNHGIARNGGDQLVFVYFYVWDTPARDAEEGVLSVRIAAPVTHDPDTTLTMLAEDFLTELFPTTVNWARF